MKIKKFDVDNFYEIVNLIIDALYKADYLLFFKGMAITRMILKDKNADFVRTTRDIDGDWIGDALPQESIEKQINIALKDTNGIFVKSYRNYREGVSAGFDIYQNKQIIGSFDLSIRKNKFYQLYNIDGIKFYGQTLEKIITDKVCVLSSHKIFRRVKDMLDLFCIIQIADINRDKIIYIAKESNKIIENFDCLLNQKENLRHAYETMYWLENKPDFDDVYEVCVNISNLFNKE